MNSYVDHSMKCDMTTRFTTCKRWPSNSDWQVVEASFKITWLSRRGRKTTAKSDCRYVMSVCKSHTDCSVISYFKFYYCFKQISILFKTEKRIAHPFHGDLLTRILTCHHRSPYQRQSLFSETHEVAELAHSSVWDTRWDWLKSWELSIQYDWL
jgi:hypothetical protein